MKCQIPEIFWHNRDPVLSIDIQPKPLDGDDKIRVASAGYDSHVLVRALTYYNLQAFFFSFQCKITCENIFFPSN